MPKKTPATGTVYGTSGSARNLLAQRLASLHVGTAVSWHGITLIPVFPGQPSDPVDYETLANALSGGRARVTEVRGGSVPELGVKQAGPLPVLLLDGDQLVGGRQNRVLNTTILVPVGIDFVLPVSCVEQGRWHATRADFGSGEIVPPSLRNLKGRSVSDSYRQGLQARASQGEVWASVAETLHLSASYSPTSDLYEAYRSMDARIEEARERLGAPVAGAIGVVAVFGGEARAADLFDKPETLAEFWPRLVRSYALEAETAVATDPAISVAAAHSLLVAGERAARTTATAFPSHGLGEDVRITAPEVTGAALVHAGVAIHAVLFGTGATAPRLPGGSATTNVPSGTATGTGTGGASPGPTGTSGLFQSVFGTAAAGGGARGGQAGRQGSPGTTTPASPRVVFETTVGATLLSLVHGDLLRAECAALIVGANKRLSGSSGLPGAIERAAGRAFIAERDRRILASSPTGFYRGSAVVTGAGDLRDGPARRAVVHAIVTKFEHGSRVPTTPDIVYAAFRQALELAESYGFESVATHPVATRVTPPGTTPLATATATVMARALWDAIVDHAAVSRHVRHVQVYERDAVRLDDLVHALREASADA